MQAGVLRSEIRHSKNMALTLTEGVDDLTFREERMAEKGIYQAWYETLDSLAMEKRA